MAKPYDQIPERRAIIRRRALEEALAHLVEDLPTGSEPPRPQVLALLRDALAAGRAEIRRRFEDAGPMRNDGPAVLVATSFLMDQLIRVIFDLADGKIYPAANPSAAERLSVVATGGFGRGEMAPLSDIDLLFLRPYKQTPRGEQIVEFMLYLLWDLGLKVGHATRTVEESLRYADRDHTIRTALLEARYIWGDRALFDELTKLYAQKFTSGDGRDFVEAKLSERDQRHQRMGDSRYVVEPNVKEGKGGLRDLHLLFWIAEYLYRVREPAELVATLGPDVAASGQAIGQQLDVIRSSDIYLRAGAFSAAEVIASWKAAMSDVMYDSRFDLVRAVESWSLRDVVPDRNELFALESEMNRYLPLFPQVIVCLYDLERFGGGIVVDLLKTHSRVLVGGAIVENPYCMTPDEILAASEAGTLDAIDHGVEEVAQWCYDATTGSN